MKPGEPVKVFISYAHSERNLREQLEKHLSPLTREHIIHIWQDQEILAGSNWNKDIHAHLNEADMVLLLVSADFLSSQYCWDDEVQKALERHRAGLLRVIPIILKPVGWKHTPLGQLQALPTDGKAVTTRSNHDAAFENVSEGIREVATKLQTTRQNGLDDKLDTFEKDALSSRQGEGKRVPALRPSADASYIVGVDIDRSHLTLVLIDCEGKVLNETSPAPFYASAGAQVCLTRVAKEIQGILEQSHVTWEQVDAIGLATPGPLDRDLRKILSVSQNPQASSQMPGWEGQDIIAILEHKLKGRSRFFWIMTQIWEHSAHAVLAPEAVSIILSMSRSRWASGPASSSKGNSIVAAEMPLANWDTHSLRKMAMFVRVAKGAAWKRLLRNQLL